jgi:dihydroneopterin aldolase
MSVIRINNIRVHARHGCLPEEAVIGGTYRIDAEIFTDFSAAAQTDDLTKTVDYCDVQRIVVREMAVRSKLIEHVLHRIGQAMIQELPRIDRLQLTLTKLAPPMGGDVESVAVTDEFVRARP